MTQGQGAPADAHPLQLHISEPHPFLNRFRFMGSSQALILVGPISLALFLLAAAVDGNLTQASLKPVLCEDARSYLGAGKHLCSGYTFSQEMSALRDMPTLIVAAVLPLTISLMFRQWENITYFLSAMDDRGILGISDRPRVYEEVRRCNRYFDRWAAWNPVVGLGSLLSMLFVTRAQTAGRLYPTLPTSPGGFGVEPQHWWASLAGLGLAGGVVPADLQLRAVAREQQPRRLVSVRNAGRAGQPGALDSRLLPDLVATAGEHLLMVIGNIRIKSLEFPGKAGELQRQGATAALVRELGDNYADYHQFLAAELDKVPRRPDERDVAADPEGFLAKWQHIEDIISAELLLRVSRAYRKFGRSLNADADFDPPLVDLRDRLLSVETGAPLSGARGTVDAPRSTPPMPKWFG